MILKYKLRKCPHRNVNAYRYIRDDGAVEEQIHRKVQFDDMRLTYMEFCLDCGSTKRYHSGEFPHEAVWFAPWMWRKFES